ncbi:TOBE domain-containing protein [bacterium]|nr:TOBE domain-containing protein [bacterium]
MSDRIAVMNEGKLVQVGGSEEIYESPTNLFVASFVGDMCFLPAVVTEAGSVRLSGGEIVHAKTSSAAGTEITLTVRPEKLHLYSTESETPPNRNAIRGVVSRRTFYGGSLFYEVDIGASGSFDVRVENLPVMTRWVVGDEVVVDFHPESARALAE